jgi:hypothetical protein
MSVTRVSYTPEGFVTPEDIAANAQAATPPQPTIQPTARVVGGTERFTAGAGSESMGPANYVASQAGVAGGSVAATLQGYGAQRSVELEPGNPASRTLVAHAIRDGLLIRDYAGNLIDAPDQAERVADAQKQPEEQKQEDPGEGHFDADADKAWAAAIEPLPQHAYDGAAASVIGAVTTGNWGLDRVAEGLAKSASLEPGEARAFVEAGYQMHRAVVDRTAASVGIDGPLLQQFYADARSRPGELQNALQELVLRRDVSAFKRMASQFASNVAAVRAKAARK